jgi:hypothetical protein
MKSVVAAVVPVSLGGSMEESPGDKGEAQQKANQGMKKGGMVRSSASKRADGCAIRGKTKGRMV